jgi:hypothetical protein
MPFVKRPLTPHEFSGLDFASLGVVERRIPPSESDWAVDSGRCILCTQLISNTWEMREGDYWYLLLVSNSPFIFKVDAFRSAAVGGRERRYATVESSGISSYDMNTIKRLASEAHQAVSYAGEELVFY